VQDDNRRTLELAAGPTVIGTELGDIALIEVVAIAHRDFLTSTKVFCRFISPSTQLSNPVAGRPKSRSDARFSRCMPAAKLPRSTSGSNRVTEAQLVPVAAAADGASDPAEHQQHDTYDEKYPADGGNDGRYRQQITDNDENDAENDQRILLGSPEETYMVVKMRMPGVQRRQTKSAGFDLLAGILQARLRLINLALVLGVLITCEFPGSLFSLTAQVVIAVRK
jgi:hypothetical protein